MPIEPWRPCNPANGDHFLMFERRFRYLLQDPSHQLRVSWIPTVLECPVCQAEYGMRLALQESQDLLVQAQCHRGHIWPEPRIDRRWFASYSRLRAGLGEPDELWLLESGFGEEPPEPIDTLGQLKEGWTYGAKWVGRKAKNKVRAEIRRPVKKARKKAANEAMRPIAAALRTAWSWQAEGVEPVKKPRAKKAPAPPKTPSAAAYRKAYGMDAPKRGPKCLVCDDTGRITAPGISIACSECGTGKAQSASAGRGTAKPTTVMGNGQTVNAGVYNPPGGRMGNVRNEGGRPARQITADVQQAIDRAARTGTTVNSDVVNHGRIGNVQANGRGNRVTARAEDGER